MDTVTQALLGGAVGYLVAGRKSPKKAILWGAAIAVLPDLDVFIHHDSDLDAFVSHRSWTHSWIVQTIISPVLAYGLHKLDDSFRYVTWWWLIWLALVTHSALDALTVYGTQLFWPLMLPPVSGGSVFIIDPMYSLPLLAGFIAILSKPKTVVSRRIMLTGFVFSCCYLLSGILVQNRVEQQAETALNNQQIPHDKVLVTASPFNIFLWRVLAVDDDYYYQGFRSVFDHDNNFNFTQYKRRSELKQLVEDLPSLEKLDWFTHGFYALEQQQDLIIARDLRMGIEPSYFFNFVLAKRDQRQVKAVQAQRVKGERLSMRGLQLVWQRIWNDNLQLNFDATK